MLSAVLLIWDEDLLLLFGASKNATDYRNIYSIGTVFVELTLGMGAFTAKALRMYCGVMCIFGIQIPCQKTFVAVGNAPCSIIVAIVRMFVLLLPLIYLMPNLVSDKTMLYSIYKFCLYFIQ